MLQTKNYTRDEIFALMVINAPNPSKDHIDLHTRLDMSRNPHNDPPPKPQRRSDHEIIADYKIEYATVLMRRLEQTLVGNSNR